MWHMLSATACTKASSGYIMKPYLKKKIGKNVVHMYNEIVFVVKKNKKKKKEKIQLFAAMWVNLEDTVPSETN
jgi:hypothetical protein